MSDAPPPYRWSPTPPDRPGYYWMRNDRGWVKIVQYDVSEGVLRLLPHEWHPTTPVAWSGPIPEPAGGE